MAKRALQGLWARSLLGRKQRTIFCGKGAELPPDTLIEEEIVPDYQASTISLLNQATFSITGSRHWQNLAGVVAPRSG